MARFSKGDTARLNYRKSKEGYYGENGRVGTCVKYLGDSKWQVLVDGKKRKWFTADMDNVTGLASVETVRLAVEDALASL